MNSNFKKFSTAVAISTFLVGVSGARAELVKYDIEPGHTLVTWFADHMGYTTMDGKFSDIKGTLMLDEKDPSKSKVEAIIDITQQETGNKTFNYHLSTPDWFDTSRFGEAKFVSDKVVVDKKDKNKAKIYGTLEFRGFKKEVVLDAKLNKKAVFAMDNKERVGFSATGKINRKDYGMVSLADKGQIGTDIELNIQLEAVKAE